MQTEEEEKEMGELEKGGREKARGKGDVQKEEEGVRGAEE